MKINITLVLLLVSMMVGAQAINVENGYYRIDNGTDEEYHWTLHFEDSNIKFYNKSELIFDYGKLEKKSEVRTDTLVKFEFVNPNAPEWHGHIVSIHRDSYGDLNVSVEFSIEEYSDFLKETSMTPKGFSTSYFIGPMKKEDALDNWKIEE